ncbi:hypothetical protein [Mesorhizobium sp. M1163]|uniref:hypothetical protein n=1 Tax=Mesorhizobium sp. M1163 TaxID=2957065 RepID=UPI00333625DF
MAGFQRFPDRLWYVVLAGSVCAALALMLVLVSSTESLPLHTTYVKYGCIPDDPSKREWDQYLGLSACK